MTEGANVRVAGTGKSWRLDVLGELANENDVRVLYLDDVLCPDGVCKFIKNGQIPYRDKNHLSYAGAMLLVDKFFKALRETRKPLALTSPVENPGQNVKLGWLAPAHGNLHKTAEPPTIPAVLKKPRRASKTLTILC